MPSLTQEGRKLRSTTPLGGDVLVPVSFTGTEALSRPYEFTIDFVSETEGVDASRLLGKGLTLHLDCADESVRHIHGLVRRFSSLGKSKYLSRYRAEIVPNLWFLSLFTDCRTFENKTAIEVVEEVCRDAGVTGIKKRLAGQPPTRDYIVQYQETNLQFVSRLLEEIGVYYAFEHSDGAHTCVLTDSQAGTIPAGAVPQVRVDSGTMGDRPLDDTVFAYSREFAVHSAKVSLVDHDLLRPDSAGEVSSGGSHARGERYAFLGDLGLDRSPADASLRIEEEERDHEILRGKSSCPAFQSGTRVKMVEAPSDLDGEEFHLVEVRHSVQGGDVHASSALDSRYENEFVAIPMATRYRPSRTTPRPSVKGTHVAKVVGSGGAANIDVDEHGRVLLEFPWDRGAGKDGKSAHRVHVASVWGGVKWGFVQLPRINQEVLVEYVEGDVDRPIITGRVYNSQHKPPYDLPANKTQSGWKSQTLEGGSDNFNELRFEDKKGSEHVYLQAEKDLKALVKNDETRDVQHDRTTTIKNHDTRTVSEGNDTHTVTKGNQTVTVKKGDQTIKVETGKQTVTIKDNQTITVESGNRDVKVDTGNDSLKVAKGNLAVDVSMGNITIKAGMGSITVEAMQKIELKVGANSITIDQMGVKVKGTMVKIEGTAQAEMKSPMTKVEGSGMMEVKGAMTQVKGDGILIAKGAITMIN